MNNHGTPRLVEKLKARKVAQWTAAYFAGAWGLLEVVGFLANQFAWPDFIVRSLTVILGSGFFVVIVLAWYHGDRGKQRVTSIEAMAIGAILVAGAIVTVLVQPPEQGAEIPQAGGPVTRLNIALPREQRLAIRPSRSFPFAISPDGAQVAYVAFTSEGSRLVLRRFDSFESRMLDGTADARHPFFSADGQWVGFFTSDEIRKVPVDGGSPLTVAHIRGRSFGASWGTGGTIVYSLGREGLWRVSAAGGEPAMITPVYAEQKSQLAADPAVNVAGSSFEWPSILPDEQHAIVSDGSSVYLLHIESGAMRRLVAVPGRQARYLRSGHLAYTETGERVRAIAFDLETLEVTGTPFPILEDVFRGPGSGAVFFDVSHNGTLLFVSGGFERSLMLADRNGQLEPVTEEKRGFRWPKLSPNGDRVAVIIDPRPSELWLYDLARGVGHKVSPEGHNIRPAWQANPERLVFVNSKSLLSIDPDDPNSVDKLYSWGESQRVNFYPSSASPAGEIIIGNQVNETSGFDVYSWEQANSSGFQPVANTRATEYGGDISPGGDWVAYASDAGSSDDVYLQPYPGSDGAVRVTHEGGKDPHWSHDGSELFFRRGESFFAIKVISLEPPEFADPQLLFRAELDTTQDRNWDVGPSDRFVLVQSDPTTTREFQVVLNWFQTLSDSGD
jgi:serine/threonine-protein kinase